MTGSKNGHEEVLGRLGHLIDLVHAQRSQLTFDKTNRQHAYCICLHGTILELATGAKSLIETKNYAAVPSVVRTVLEALCDQVNLVSSSEYFERMHLLFLTEKRRALKSLKRNYWTVEGDPDIVPLHEVEQMLGETEAQIAEYKSSGVKDIRILDKIQEAGKSRYGGVYWLLCNQSHNNIQALERRHFEWLGGGTDYRISYFRPWTAEELSPYVYVIGVAVAESLGRVAGLLGVTDRVSLGEVDTAFKEFRRLYECNVDRD